jgi:hypothetical protein
VKDSAQLDLTPGDMPEAFGLRGVEWTATELRIDVAPSYLEWERLIVGLFRAERAIMFAIGDALAWGIREYGESAYQVEATLDKLGLRRSPETLRKYLWVAEKVAPSRRRDDVSFTAHVEVAKLEPAEQTRWLARAASEGWSSRELREHLVGPPPEPGQLPAESVEDVARLISNVALPDKDGRVCIAPDLFARLRRALGETV